MEIRWVASIDRDFGLMLSISRVSAPNKHASRSHLHSVSRNFLGVTVAIDGPGQGEHQFENFFSRNSRSGLADSLGRLQKPMGFLDQGAS